MKVLRILARNTNIIGFEVFGGGCDLLGHRDVMERLLSLRIPINTRV